MVCRDNSGSKNKRVGHCKTKGNQMRGGGGGGGVNYGLPKDVTTTDQKQENNTAAKKKALTIGRAWNSQSTWTQKENKLTSKMLIIIEGRA